jgi:hypothetical protein
MVNYRLLIRQLLEGPNANSSSSNNTNNDVTNRSCLSIHDSGLISASPLTAISVLNGSSFLLPLILSFSFSFSGSHSFRSFV